MGVGKEEKWLKILKWFEASTSILRNTQSFPILLVLKGHHFNSTLIIILSYMYLFSRNYFLTLLFLLDRNFLSVPHYSRG